MSLKVNCRGTGKNVVMPDKSALGLKQLRVTDNLDQLLEVLPVKIRQSLVEHEDVEDLL